MTLIYIKKLGLQTQKTNFATSKIDELQIDTFDNIIARLQVLSKLAKAHLLQKNFLLANINIEMVLGLFFLIVNNAYINLQKKK